MGSQRTGLAARVGIHLSLAVRESYVDEAAGVQETLLRAALGGFGLFLLVDLYRREGRLVESLDMVWHAERWRTLGVWPLTLPARAREP